jgi:copper chaperone CopZ
MTETSFKVRGLKCGHCVAKATEAVSKLPGVTEARFDFKVGSGIVKGEFDPEAVIDALTGAGYPAEIDD